MASGGRNVLGPMRWAIVALVLAAALPVACGRSNDQGIAVGPAETPGEPERGDGLPDPASSASPNSATSASHDPDRGPTLPRPAAGTGTLWIETEAISFEIVHCNLETVELPADLRQEVFLIGSGNHEGHPVTIVLTHMTGVVWDQTRLEMLDLAVSPDPTGPDFARAAAEADGIGLGSGRGRGIQVEGALVAMPGPFDLHLLRARERGRRVGAGSFVALCRG